jgi:tetratricopeptide (TPR) repeat protein
LLEGLGRHRRPVTSSSIEAQRFFDQGLSLLYAFNHDEAIRSFRKAAEIDPRCPMAWWGIALANGPHINNPLMTPEKSAAAWEALQQAHLSAARGNEVERDLIAALAKRYANPPPEDRRPLDEAYAAAMRDLARKYAADADIGALFAESLMDLRPWDLWTPAGEPQPGTEEIVAVLEGVLERSPHHPLGLHLMIHAVEASLHPEKADAAADRLRDLAPGLGHLVHMPSHIDVRRGRWAAAIIANEKAIAADVAYREKSPKQDFYRIYMAHNHHMLSYAAIMRGQSKKAIDAINSMASGIPPEWVKENAAMADGFTAMPLEVLVRFGRWDEVLSAPEPPEYLPLARALRHCSRGIALAAKGDAEGAKVEQAAFVAAKAAVSEEAVFGNNKASDLLAVGERLLAGEILYRLGQADEAIAALREAVEKEDALRYAEPPDWIHPVRHALGAVLLHQGRAAEAEEVYRADLAKLPDNGWALYGLAQSLKMQGKLAEAIEVQERFEKAWADADVEISSSCYCQPAR